MSILGVVLLIIGFIAKIAIIWTLGIIVVLDAVLAIARRVIGGRHSYKRAREVSRSEQFGVRFGRPRVNYLTPGLRRICSVQYCMQNKSSDPPGCQGERWNTDLISKTFYSAAFPNRNADTSKRRCGKSPQPSYAASSLQLHMTMTRAI
jgi:hypothetical protein